MLIKLMRVLETVTGYLLGMMCAGLQIGTTLICLCIVLTVPVILAGWTR